MFQKSAPGALVDIHGNDSLLGPWHHKAFVPDPLPTQMPELSPSTFLAVANARAALASLDSTAAQLPNPSLLRATSMRTEAQSTSALEGTYAPLEEVLKTVDDEHATPEILEIFNYVRMADYAFTWISERRPISTSFLEQLHTLLFANTELAPVAGRLRDQIVVIGRRDNVAPGTRPVHAARFVPTPAGIQLETGLHELLEWLKTDHSQTIDPIVAAALSHYQFEALHPFLDGNGRIGRLLIVLYLQQLELLSEPTLAVSPWFESHRREYYDRLLAISTHNDWDSYIRFFARGVQVSASTTRSQMLALVAVQAELKDLVRSSNLRADSALALVDYLVAQPSFTVDMVRSTLDVSYGRARTLVKQLVDLGILAVIDPNAYQRRYFAPTVLQVLLGTADNEGG